MTKTDLINFLAENFDITKKDAGLFINAVATKIADSLKKGEAVILTGFGSFKVVRRAERTGVNPQTKQKIRIPATKVPKFKASKKLKEMVK
jgi:DNA-binding protein HU-beta